MLRFPVDRSNRAAFLSLTLSLQLLDVVDSTEHKQTGECAGFHSSSRRGGLAVAGSFRPPPPRFKDRGGFVLGPRKERRGRRARGLWLLSRERLKK